MADPTPAPPSRDDLWKQYQIQTDLYRHYLELVLKFNVYYYAVAGVIASFCLSRPSPAGPTRSALLFPALLGFGLAVVCIYGAILNENARAEIVRIVTALGQTTWPEVRVPGVILVLPGVLFLVAAVALAVVAFCPSVLGLTSAMPGGRNDCRTKPQDREGHEGRRGPAPTLDDTVVRPEKRAEYFKLITDAQNFFKHADREPANAVLEFYPEPIAFSLLDVVDMLQRYTGRHHADAIVVLLWFGV